MFTQDLKTRRYGLRDLLLALFRRWQIAALFALGVLAVTGLDILLSAPEYEVSASILLKKERADAPLAPGQADINVYDEISPEDINSEIGILRSRVVLRAAVLAVNAPTPDEPLRGMSAETTQGTLRSGQRPANSASDTDTIVDRVAETLKVEPLPRSNIITLRLESADPEWAVRFVAALLQQYQIRRAQLLQSPGAVAFFKEQVERTADRLANAEELLQKKLATAGVTIIDDANDAELLAAEKQAALEGYRDFYAQLGSAEAEYRQLQSRLEKIRSQIFEEELRLQRSVAGSIKAKLLADIENVNREETELIEELEERENQLATVTRNLKQVLGVEDRLRALLLNNRRLDGNSASQLETKRQIDKLYTELADLGQFKRYDLHIGQDTSLHATLKDRIIDARVELSGVQRRKAHLTHELETLQEGGSANRSAALSQGQEMNAQSDSTETEDIWTLVEAAQQRISVAAERLAIKDKAQLAPVFEELVRELVRLESDLAGVSARRDSLNTQVTDYREKLNNLTRHSLQLKNLDRDVKLAQRAYNNYTEKFEQAALSAEMTKRSLVNTSISEPPLIPSKPSSMGAFKRLILALGIAFVGGMGLVFAAELVDHSIVSAEELERRTGLEHLGTVLAGDTEPAIYADVARGRRATSPGDTPFLARGAPSAVFSRDNTPSPSGRRASETGTERASGRLR